MSLIAIIVVGLIAGWLASAIMKTNTGLLLDLVLGVIGAIVGGWISSLITGVNLVGDINLTSIVVSLLGAILVIAVYRFIRRGRA
ncbi:MAG TPA: GlsB/YeaQ/YmgE family stress response membrane protein [Anaerolinea sp.]|nr:GlsB/YeaQ/YmgE family stress response membrane protein [Anaerolinea sp.]